MPKNLEGEGGVLPYWSKLYRVHLGFTCCVLSYRTSLYWFYDRLFNMAVAIKVNPVMRSKGVERQCLEVGDQNNLCHFNEQSISPCTTARDSQIRTQASSRGILGAGGTVSL